MMDPELDEALLHGTDDCLPLPEDSDLDRFIANQNARNTVYKDNSDLKVFTSFFNHAILFSTYFW